MFQFSCRCVSLLYRVPLWWWMDVSGRKHSIKSNVGQRGFILAYSSGGRESIVTGKSWGRERHHEVRSKRLVTFHAYSRNRAASRAWQCDFTTPPMWHIFFQQGSAYWRFHNLWNCTTNWRLGIQTHESVGEHFMCKSQTLLTLSI